MGLKWTQSNEWTQSNGGPLLLLEEGALPYWQGVTNEPEPDDPATDYGRSVACQAQAATVVPVGPFEGVVLGGFPALCATWWIAGGDIALLRTCCTDCAVEELEAESVLASMGARPGDRHTLRYSVASQPLHLFDSAYAGNDAHQAPTPSERRLPSLIIPVKAALFDIHSATYEASNGCEVILHWLHARPATVSP